MSKKYDLIAAILIVALAVALSATLIFGGANSKNEPSALSSSLTKDADKPYCVLVAGSDRVSGLYDVMMLVSIDGDRERICVMQLPRDTYAEYTEKSYKKLNGAAYTLGGIEGLRSFLEQSFGVCIDGYLTLGLEDFRKVIDTLGGVEIELERAIKYTDAEQGLFIDIPSGRQVLDGEHAEMLVRYRAGYADGDLGRLDAQKKFLAALFETLKEKVNGDNAFELAKTLIGEVDTDIGAVTAVTLGLRALKLGKENIVFLTLPGADARAEKSGASYYVASAYATDKILCEFFGKSPQIEFDGDRVFCHPNYKGFISIYESSEEPRVVRADELE